MQRKLHAPPPHTHTHRFYSRPSSHGSSSLGKPGKHVVSFGLGFTERRRRKSTSQATVLKGRSRRGRRTAPRRVQFTFLHITPTAVTSRCFVLKSKDASLRTSTRVRESCFLFLVTHLWKITRSSMRTGVNRTFNECNRQGYSAVGSPAVRDYKLGFRVLAAPPPHLR